MTTSYGDVFEAIVYSYCGERLGVCKSVSEPFLDNERADAIDDIERRFLQNAAEEGDDPKTWKVSFRRLTTFVAPKISLKFIEADVFGEVGSPEQLANLRSLKKELRPNNGYLKRPRVGSCR